MPTCYLCPSTEDITRDHVPPASFFPPESRNDNLITVPCCRACNERHGKEDEQVLRWMTTCAFNSAQGRWVFDNKVAKTLRKSARLSESIIASMREMTIRTEQGEIKGYSYPIPTEVFHRFTVRICKGLLKHFMPAFDYSKTTFLTEMAQPTPEQNALLKDMLSQMTFVASKGDTVFRFWHGFVREHPDKGIFILMFYGGIVILAFYGNDIKLPDVAMSPSN